MTTNYLATPLGEIGDTHLLSLIADLEQVTGVRRILNYNLPFGMYLHDCLRPNGAEFPPILITPQMLRIGIEVSVLNKKINKFNDTPLYSLCDEIAKSRRLSIENVSNKSVYAFINESYKNPPKRQGKKGPRDNRLWG